MDNRIKTLATSINKLNRRGAERNIRKIIKKTHVVDVAEVLESMGTESRLAIFQWIEGDERQAEVLSHLGKNSQIEIAHVLETVHLQKLLSAMESHDAADLLGQLPEEMSQNLLSGLSKDELQDVEELMAYPDDAAGGLMGSEFLTLNESLSVSRAIQEIQNQDEDNISFYIYVVSDSQKLVGVLSLKQLLLCRPKELLKDIMSSDVISVEVSAEQNEVAKIVERYDFLSLPVTDGVQKLVGVITVDDVIDVIRGEAEEDFYAMGLAGASFEEPTWTHLRVRLPWLILSLLGGLLCFLLLWNSLLAANIELSAVLCLAFLPLLFLTTDTMCSQTVTTIVGLLRARNLKGKSFRKTLKKELLIGSLVSLLAGGLVLLFVLISQSWFPGVSYHLAALIVLQLWSSVLISMSVPLLISRVGLDPLVAAPSLSVSISSVLSVLLLMGFYALG